MKLLVSVRSVEEALLAAEAGVDFIDLKEPGAGALGGLPLPVIAAIVEALSGQGGRRLVSATIGDLPMGDVAHIEARVDEVGACGVDYVKVGVERTPEARKVLDALARCGRPVVPVFIADQGLHLPDVEHACALGFAGVMVDTQDKKRGSLFEALTADELRRFVAVARKAEIMVGLAGALRMAHAPVLQSLAPDFAGFRSAVCAGDRAGALDPVRLAQLLALMRGQMQQEQSQALHAP